MNSPISAFDLDLDFYLRHYPDTGCWASGSCLACPLQECKHDSDSPQSASRRYRWERIRQALASGRDRTGIMAQFGVGKRTVSRVAAKMREEV